jgi:hypothetical protein
MKQRRRKGIRGLILALATAAVLVPAASGKTYEGGSGGYVNVAEAPSYSPQALQAMNERWTKLGESYQQHARPDDRSGLRVIGTATAPDLVDRQLANLEAKAALVAQSFHVDDRSGVRGPGPVETPSVVTKHDGGFDWTDAGIGASVALLGAALLGAATLTRRRTGLAV